MDEQLRAAVVPHLEDESALVRFTAAALPTFFGKAAVGAVDWRKAARQAVENLDLPTTPDRWFAAAQTVAAEIHSWSMADDDDLSWFTREEQARRRAVFAGESCDAWGVWHAPGRA